MDLIFLCIFILVFAFIWAVVGVAWFKPCSIQKATIICRDCIWNFLKQVLSALFSPSPMPGQFYPVFVGHDGCRIVPQFVNEAFSEIRANFAVCYYASHQILGNGSGIAYHFPIQRKPNFLNDEELQQIIQKQAEAVLTRWMQDLGCYMPAESLTLVVLKRDALSIAFACNQAGVAQIDRLKLVQRRRLSENSQPKNSGTLGEDWEDKDND